MVKFLLVFISKNKYRSSSIYKAEDVLSVMDRIISMHSDSTQYFEYPTSYDDFTILKNNKQITIDELKLMILLEVE